MSIVFILAMCTCPRLVRHELLGRKYTEVVPCGKCHECLSKSQNEFAALAVLEAKKSKSMHFCTFTYSNKFCPVMVSTLSDEGEILDQHFIDFSERLKVIDSMSRQRLDRGRIIEYLVEFVDGNMVYEPSLKREDVRLFLKRMRQAYKREFGELPSFRYACFGEYGDQYFRPHTHFLFFDMSFREMAFFKTAWQSEFGFMDVKFIPVLNADGSPARVKVSRYVSKYLRKPKIDFEPLLRGLVESPRLCCSKGFGRGVLPDNLKDFYLCNDLSHLDEKVRFEEILKRRKSLVIDGVKFPLPRRLSDEYFRIEVKPEKREHVSVRTGEITFQSIRKTARSTLSLKVSRFARDRYLQGIIDKVRQYSETHSDEDVDRFVQEISSDEESSLEDRAFRARQFYLQHLKKQKYG